jgi:IclR helix-turn-helix domain
MHPDEAMQVSITLSRPQVEEVLRAASQSTLPSPSALIAAAVATPAVAAARRSRGGDGRAAAPGKLPTPGELSDRRLSRSLLRGLSILTRFGEQNRERGIVELARELGMSPSTTHRYALTLVEIGLLERCPDSRKYRLPHGAWRRAAGGASNELEPATAARRSTP